MIRPRFGGIGPQQAGTQERDVLVARALAALNATPITIARAEGVDSTDLPLLLAGAGDPAQALRLARALEQAGAELEQLARELSAAAGEGRR